MTEESSQSESTAPGNAAEAGPHAAPQSGPHAGPEAAPVGKAGGAGVAGEARVAGEVPETGDPRVDEALSVLAALGEAPDTEHVQAFEHVHRQLHEILGEVAGDDKPGQEHDRR